MMPEKSDVMRVMMLSGLSIFTFMTNASYKDGHETKAESNSQCANFRQTKKFVCCSKINSKNGYDEQYV